jgi:hypothetical protein
MWVLGYTQSASASHELRGLRSPTARAGGYAFTVLES